MYFCLESTSIGEWSGGVRSGEELQSSRQTSSKEISDYEWQVASFGINYHKAKHQWGSKLQLLLVISLEYNHVTSNDTVVTCTIKSSFRSRTVMESLTCCSLSLIIIWKIKKWDFSFPLLQLGRADPNQVQQAVCSAVVCAVFSFSKQLSGKWAGDIKLQTFPSHRFRFGAFL